MQAYAGTDIGCVRTMNQDGYFCSTTPIGPFPNLFIVADGMGGHQAGVCMADPTAWIAALIPLIPYYFHVMKKYKNKSQVQVVED